MKLYLFVFDNNNNHVFNRINSKPLLLIMKTIEPNFMNSFYAKKLSLLARSQKFINLFDILYFHFRLTYNLILIQLNWPLMSTQAMKPNSAKKKTSALTDLA